MRNIVSLMKRWGGTGKLYDVGTFLNTRPAKSYFEPWQGQNIRQASWALES
jgi:hypothetical protein